MTRVVRPDLAELQQRIGHRFADPALLAAALTHTSAASRAGENYQRLEFVGDRVLGLTVAAMIYSAFPGEGEGEMALRLNAMVRRDSCAEVARSLGLGAHIVMTAGEAQSGGRDKPVILGDAVEALIAALYLDAGFDVARAFVETHWRPLMQRSEEARRDAKTTLQEWAQGRGLPAPTYRQTGRSGPDHAPQFVVAVDVAGYAPAEARGASKREAERSAAEAMLKREGVWS